jgi:hypothetical protein
MADRKQTFTPEFRAEAVRLAQTSGRSRREIAADLGVGLPRLAGVPRHWPASPRNDGRLQIGIPGRLRRNTHSWPSPSARRHPGAPRLAIVQPSRLSNSMSTSLHRTALE